MDCEFCTDPAVVFDVPTPFGRRSLCRDCLSKHRVRSPPDRRTRKQASLEEDGGRRPSASATCLIPVTPTKLEQLN